MTPASSERDVGSTLVVLRILHAAMAGSVLLYGGIAALLTRNPPDSLAERAAPPGYLTPVLGVAAVVVLAAAILVRRHTVARGRDRLFKEDPSGRATTGKPDARARTASYLTRKILSWALVEAAAIFGLVLAFIHWDLMQFLPFGAASMLVLLLLAPTRRELEEYVGR
jgi:hypothetical protein